MATQADKLRGETKIFLDRLDKCSKQMISRHDQVVESTLRYKDVWVRALNECLSADGVTDNCKVRERDHRLDLLHMKKLVAKDLSNYDKAAGQAYFKLGELGSLLNKKEKKKLFYRKTHPKIVKAEKALDKGEKRWVSATDTRSTTNRWCRAGLSE